ncbi:MAG: hypothetical protein U0105_22335 [Candidatus Obscuribacterales bacterium]
MEKPVLTSVSLIAFLLCTPLVKAQNAGTAATGDGANTTQTTFQNNGATQVKHDNSAFDRSQQLGTGQGAGKDTKSTKTKDYLENSENGGLPETSTKLIAPDSVSPKPIGRQAQTLGFQKGIDEEYKGPYQTSGASGGTLPYTSTGAVDIDIIGGGSSGGGVDGVPDGVPASQWKSNKSQWGSYQNDDAAPTYGLEDSYGFIGDD